MDQLHMHFTQAIHNTVFQVVLGYVELCAGNADTKFQKMQYKDLCTVNSWCYLFVQCFEQLFLLYKGLSPLQLVSAKAFFF